MAERQDKRMTFKCRNVNTKSAHNVCTKFVCHRKGNMHTYNNHYNYTPTAHYVIPAYYVAFSYSEYRQRRLGSIMLTCEIGSNKYKIKQL